jgi:hypothetical protein
MDNKYGKRLQFAGISGNKSIASIDELLDNIMQQFKRFINAGLLLGVLDMTAKFKNGQGGTVPAL